jgi:poly(3-hydroxybutyrate) depolymerase
MSPPPHPSCQRKLASLGPAQLAPPRGNPACAIVLGLALLWPGPALGEHDAIPDPAPATSDAELPGDLDLSAVTVSGLSSGGFFAHQFHVAYSQSVAGAGIVAGGPYGCVETISNPYWPFSTLDRLSAALVACTHYWGDRYWGLRPGAPDASDSVTLIEAASDRGEIDDPGFLSGDRAWLFHGELDEVVPEAVFEALEGVYSHYLEAPALEVHRHAAAHGLPVSRFPDDSRFAAPDCDEHKAPFLVACGFDAVELMLRHLHPGEIPGTPADSHQAGSLMPFDQTRFFEDPQSSLRAAGYVYVPDPCRTQSCRLHVAFHGCRQTIEAVHDDFVRDAGYNGWAAAARIVVLYPQVTASPANPNGCWDFWGYSGDDYRVQDGRQMRAVKAMIARMLEPAE